QSAIDSALMHSGDPHLTAEVFRLWQENELLNDTLFVKGVDKLIKLFISDIGLVEAEGNYIIIHTRHNRFAVKMSLRQIKQRLSIRRFIQVHRKYLAQLTHIESINLSNNEVEVGGHKIPIGASYKSQLLERLNKL
ncbi:MAG: LytTR family transcriptional regulator, partial [Lewinellaceae bacterium]|nr:LytTR family transcriptional regulator [Lewinellaceae bacterium]